MSMKIDIGRGIGGMREDINRVTRDLMSEGILGEETEWGIGEKNKIWRQI